MSIPDPQDRQQLLTHVMTTYHLLRVGVAILAILFPILLFGVQLYRGFENPGSMSAFYWAEIVPDKKPTPQDDKAQPCDQELAQGAAPTETPRQNMAAAMIHPIGRAIFVGCLFAIASFLYFYKGYTARENVALNVAAVMAVCVALFPMEWNCRNDAPIDCRAPYYCFPGVNPHGFAAGLLFVALGYVMRRHSGDTLHLVRDENRRRGFQNFYRSMYTIMLASPAIAGVWHIFNGFNGYTFFIEAVGIWAFAGYWLGKSRELRMTTAD